MDENRTNRFNRIAENRTYEIIKRIRILGNCSNRSSYDYTEQQVSKIFAAIDAELRVAKARFTFTKENTLTTSAGKKQAKRASSQNAPSALAAT